MPQGARLESSVSRPYDGNRGTGMHSLIVIIEDFAARAADRYGAAH
jgi:hypothetical protein